MPKDMPELLTPSNLVLAEIGALKTAVGNAPQSRQIAAARAALADAKKACQDAEAALERYFAVRIVGELVLDDPELSRLQKVRDKARLALDDAHARVAAARAAHAPVVRDHLAQHAPELRRHLADAQLMLVAIAGVIREGGDLAKAVGASAPAEFISATAVSTAATYLKARFAS